MNTIVHDFSPILIVHPVSDHVENVFIKQDNNGTYLNSGILCIVV